MSSTKIIVGLGNPGREYVGTRHNVGFEVLDLLAGRLGAAIEQKKFGSLFGEAMLDEQKIYLLKPQQYMNLSGQAVATAMGFYKIPFQEMIVVADDLALTPGIIRIRTGGSSGGHNGLRDIISKLGTDRFARLRVGIGPADSAQTRDYVLGRPGEQDSRLIQTGIQKARDALLCWIREGVVVTMNNFNAKNGSDQEREKQ